MGRLIRALIGLFCLVGAVLAEPDGEQQIRLAAEGRYEELAQRFEFLLHKKNAAAADLHGLCFAYHKIKNYERLGQCLDALDARIKAGDLEGRLFGADDLTPYAAILRSESANEVGDYLTAITEAGQALEWFDREKEGAMVEIDTLSALVLGLTRVGDGEAARGYVERLEKVSTGWLFGSDYKTAKSLALARCYLALGEYEKAWKAISKDFLFDANKLLDRLFSGSLVTGENLWLWQDLPRQFMLGHALLESGRIEEAKRRLTALAESRHVKQNGGIHWQLLYDLGRIAQRQGHLEQAALHFRQSVDVIEQHRRNIDTEANKIGFAADRQMVYADLVDTLYRLGRFPQMLEYVERAKARALVDLLARKWSEAPPERLDAGVAAQFTQLKQLDDAARLQVGNKDQEARARIQRAREDLYRTDPMFASLIAVQGVDADSIARSLAADETLLEYFTTGTALYALALDRGGVHAVKLNGAGLSELISDYRCAIPAQSGEVTAMAQRLYDRLLRPLEGRLRERLTVVPHGPLHYLSFASLHDGRSWLIDRHSLRILPSGNVDALLRAGARRPTERSLILANPDTGVAANDLQFAEAEARSVAGVLPRPHLLTRRDATETALRKESGGVGYLHLASHGKFRAAEPLKSYLLLAPDRDNDGVLSVDELYGLKLDADLVALSACDTGLGQGSAGDDVVGFVRGFFFSGARSLLASYWSVDDAATADLMRSFYANLKTLGKARALREAQREVARTRPEPLYWAGFYLAGLGD